MLDGLKAYGATLNLWPEGAPWGEDWHRGGSVVAGTITPAEALGRAVGEAEPALDESPGKAAFPVLLRPIQQLNEDLWQVTSGDGLRLYAVRNGECQCSRLPFPTVPDTPASTGWRCSSARTQTEQ